MKSIKALFLTFWVYSTLIWLYCVARIIINNVEPWDLFINGIPITFWELGSVAFLVSAVCFYAYLYLR
jgi:hypothetical protein